MPQYRTPWSASGALTSDRLKSNKHPKQPGNISGKGNRKGKDAAPKSLRVRELGAILKRLRDGEGKGKDPEGGCFCLGEFLPRAALIIGAKQLAARSHTLSPYVPICTSCGLILCELNPPSSGCPFASCGAPLLSPTARTSLITRLESDIEGHHPAGDRRRRRANVRRSSAGGLLPAARQTSHRANKCRNRNRKLTRFYR